MHGTGEGPTSDSYQAGVEGQPIYGSMNPEDLVCPNCGEIIYPEGGRCPECGVARPEDPREKFTSNPF